MKFAQTREELLLSLINRKEPRAINEEGICEYSHRFNGGCAIGCQVGRGLADELVEGAIFIYDDMESPSNAMVFFTLPKRLQKMGSEFLSKVQTIHDDTTNYYDSITAKKGLNGLIWNKKGRDSINSLITTFNLKLTKV